MSFHFQLNGTDGLARAGAFSTPHGDVQTPAFMPVGTLGTVKGLTIDQVTATRTRVLLCNTYHLSLRPGEAIVRDLGGLHAMMGWSGPILTDSGGFQIFSLAKIGKVTEEQAVFRSHIDGRLIELTPERSVSIQETLGSDIAMVLDHVVALPNEPEVVRDATLRSIRWAARCQDAATRPDQALFAIVQGGLDETLRVECAEELAKLGFPGYAIGGLSVGEPPVEMYRILDATAPALPQDRPRYLMGVGRPEDIVEGIARGVDLFDCVMPTRNGRNAQAFTDRGKIRIRNHKYERESRPIAEGCPCPACRHSLGYLRHLFMAKEMLGPILVSAHNITYYQRLVADAREAVIGGCFSAFREKRFAGWTLDEGGDEE